MEIMEQQYSPTIYRAQKGLELSALGAKILAAITNYKRPAPLVSLGLRIEGVNTENIKLFAHGRTVEARLDHVWNQATKLLMGRIRFLLVEEDRLGAELFAIHFDPLGNVNGSYAFTADETSMDETVRHILVEVVNAIHAQLPTVKI